MYVEKRIYQMRFMFQIKDLLCVGGINDPWGSKNPVSLVIKDFLSHMY